MGLALDLIDYHPSVLLHCWLGHLTCKIVSKMTYNVSSETLNPTIQYSAYSADRWWRRLCWRLTDCRWRPRVMRRLGLRWWLRTSLRCCRHLGALLLLTVPFQLQILAHIALFFLALLPLTLLDLATKELLHRKQAQSSLSSSDHHRKI